MKKKLYSRGFTLFELLVSISIVAILTALAVVSYGGSQSGARNARRIQDMNNIQKAAEQYYASHNYTYPISTGSFTTGSDAVLQSWPNDPKNTSPYVYTFNYNALAGTYCACAYMEGNLQANSNVTCDFSAATENYYCVKSQQ